MLRFDVDAECRACGGTGLYVGFAEKDGAAVVCCKCKGTGCEHIKVEYTPFVRRKVRPGIDRVYQVNPGVMIGKCQEKGLHLTDFGGLSVAAWATGCRFSPGTEDRKHTCPCWFYQKADYDRKPSWTKCGNHFPSCKHFDDKHVCWEQWDSEQAKGA